MTRTRIQIDLDYGQAPAVVGLHYRIAREADSKVEDHTLALVGTDNKVEAPDLLYALMMIGVHAIAMSGYEIGRREIELFCERAMKAQTA